MQWSKGNKALYRTCKPQCKSNKVICGATDTASQKAKVIKIITNYSLQKYSPFSIPVPLGE